MRNVARLKMDYYPLPKAEGVKLRSLLSFAGPASVIDPERVNEFETCGMRV